MVSLLGAQNNQHSADLHLDSEVDSVLLKLYDLISVDPGSLPNWDSVKALFINQAVIVLRTSREKSTIFSLDGFVEDFQNFIKRANIIKTGFEEKILKIKTIVFGDMAQAFVLYEASIPGSGRKPQQGLDSFSLTYKDNRWLIVSITNELPSAEMPIPMEIFD